MLSYLCGIIGESNRSGSLWCRCRSLVSRSSLCLLSLLGLFSLLALLSLLSSGLLSCLTLFLETSTTLSKGLLVICILAVSIRCSIFELLGALGLLVKCIRCDC